MTDATDATDAPQLTYGSATAAGNVRTANEDRLIATGHIFCVADGMGGHAAGELAAQLAIDVFSTLQAHNDLRPEDVVAVVDEANAMIVDTARANPAAAGMGTTITGACLGGIGGRPHWIVFNVGDSRVYTFREGALTQLTTDHSEVAELVAGGRITEAEAAVHPQRSIVTRSLGSVPAPLVDTWIRPLVSGERILICSDGLTLEVSDDEIADALARSDAARDIADELVRAAVEAGGRDNISVIVIDTISAWAGTPVDVSTTPRPRSTRG